jgi:Transposase DDE domain
VDKKMANFILNVSDSTVFKALPSMVWALFGAGRKRNDGKKTASVRFHVGFDPIGLLPSGCTATSAAVDEKKEWPNIQIKPTDGDQRIAVEVADRNYPSKYQTLGELSEKGVNYVCRGKEGLQFELVEELSLSEAERAMGIERHAWVHLGSDDYRQRNKNLVRARLVWLRAESGKLVLLITNLREEDAPAEIICEMYRLRWQIEFFFWWLKKVMKGGGHWLARSENGVKTQLYLTMILSLMLHKVTGRRPSKRMLETIQLWTLGLASDEEVQSQLKKHKEQAEIARKSAQARYQKKKAAVKELANEAAKKN